MDVFSGIVGHDIPKQFFRNFLNNPHSIPHALLLTGPPGVGKFTLAFQFARSFNCLKDGTTDCDCLHCHQVNLGTFSDVFVSSSESEIKADQMRELVSVVQITPRASSHRFVIIDGFDRVNETASNIFLKTLEEPPEHLVFLLSTAKPEALLPTIYSRCIPIEFRPEQPSEVVKALESIFPETDNTLMERVSSTGCFGMAAREVHADLMLNSLKEKKGVEEPYGLLLQAFVDGLLDTSTGEFAHHLKGALQTLINSIEGRWRLMQLLPKGLDIDGLKQFVKGQLPEFNPVNFLIEGDDKARKLGEYDKGRYLLRDLTQELYSRFTKLKSQNGKGMEKLLQYLDLTREVGIDLDGNRNIELSFEKLLVGQKVPSTR
jgi:hypothetical protein